MLSAGKGKYRVWLKEARQGDDVVLFLGGGQNPHIGSVILCEPGKKPKVVNRKGHFDWTVAKPIASKVAAKRRKPVVCIAGVHVDNATKKEIGILKKNCRKIQEMVS
jgi:gallate decarboxylase subunit D